MERVLDSESSYPKICMRGCEPSRGDPVFPHGLMERAQFSPQSIQRVTECRVSYSSGPKITWPLLYLEDAPASSAQTHGWNPGLADSEGEPYKKWLQPTKLSDSLQCLSWSYLRGLTGFRFTNKRRMGGKGSCAKIQPKEATETSVPDRYGHSWSPRHTCRAPRVGLVSGSFCVLMGSAHEHNLWQSFTLWDYPIQNFPIAQTPFLTRKGAGICRQQLFKKSQIFPLYRKTFKPFVE